MALVSAPVWGYIHTALLLWIKLTNKFSRAGGRYAHAYLTGVDAKEGGRGKKAAAQVVHLLEAVKKLKRWRKGKECVCAYVQFDNKLSCN